VLLHDASVIFKEFGIPGLLGMGLGYWLFATSVRGSKGNILGQEPWEAHWALPAGGVAFGWAFWAVIAWALRP
jgi:hypothetical protein